MHLQRWETTSECHPIILNLTGVFWVLWDKSILFGFYGLMTYKVQTDPFRFAFVNHMISKLTRIIAGNGCQDAEHNNTFQVTQSVKKKSNNTKNEM